MSTPRRRSSKSLTSGKRDYVAVVPTIESVRIFGDVGVIRGTAKVTVGDKDGQPQDSAHRLHRHLGVERQALADDCMAQRSRMPDRSGK